MFIFLAALLAFFVVSIVIGYFISAPRYVGPVSDHFNGKKFINPTGIPDKGFPDVLKWMTQRKRGKWLATRNLPFGEKPVVRHEQGIRLTFVNHSTFLIQVDGVNILTDPVWSERTSPFSFAGPRRMRPPGISLDALPPIDVVLLSHNHYDHLDIATVRKIKTMFDPRFIVPLGVSAFLQQNGITKCTELDWGMRSDINSSLAVEAVPAQHFSGRGTFDRDATLWCGYMIQRGAGNIYFAGDTGYNDVTFKDVGNRHSPIALALIPIGAFKPEWFMSPIHCSPDEAVLIHLDVRSRQSIATHFGTFPLADDGFEDPMAELNISLKKRNVNPSAFQALEEGKAQNF